MSTRTIAFASSCGALLLLGLTPGCSQSELPSLSSKGQEAKQSSPEVKKNNHHAGASDKRPAGHHDHDSGHGHHPDHELGTGTGIQLGPRPYYLLDVLEDGALKDDLLACQAGPFQRTKFSIGHRGAGLQFPEHTKESYTAAARMGAGIIECDVTFTKDRELVCRHSQCDLHTTTNILATDLADKCSQPFSPADPGTGKAASAKCCTSDLTLDEFKSLCGKMDGANPAATTKEEYMAGTAKFRTDLYSTCGTLLTHEESIRLIDSLGADFTPELKSPSVEMPYEGDYTQEMYASQMIGEYKASKIHPSRVWAQSFNLDDVLYWLKKEKKFGKQAVFLDGRYDLPDFDHTDPSSYEPSMAELAKAGVNVIAPPTWMLVQNLGGEIAPSVYAAEAKNAGLEIITWTFERSGLLANNGDWYYQTIDDIVDDDGDAYKLLDVLAQDVGILGIFSDWPASVTYYANCMGL